MALPARMVPQLIDALFCWMQRAKDPLHLLILSSFLNM